MKGLSLDFHGWRGVFLWPHQPDLFNFRITLGFVTLWVCRFCVSERMSWLAKQIRRDDEEGR